MPVPMITPTPKTVRSRADRCFLSRCSGSSVSRMESSTDLIRRVLQPRRPPRVRRPPAPVVVRGQRGTGRARSRMPTLHVPGPRRGGSEEVGDEPATDDAPGPAPHAAAPARRPGSRRCGPAGRRAASPPARRPRARTPSSTARSTSTGERQAPVPPEEALRRRPRAGRLRLAGAVRADRGASSPRSREHYGLHPLAVEDAVYAHQRPKLEHYDDALFMVLKTATYVEHEQLTATSEVVDTGEVMVFLGADYVITVRHGEHGGLAELRAAPGGAARPALPGPVRGALRRRRPRRRHFVDVASAVEDDVDELETSVFSPDRTDDIGRLYQLKRELMSLRRAVAPAGGAAAEAGRAADRRRPRRDALLLPRRAGPRHPRARPGRRAGRAAHLDPAGVAGPDDAGRQRGHAQDLGLGGHHRRPHRDRRHLRDELRAHARAAAGATATRWCCWSSLVACVLLYRGFKRNGWL